MDKDTIKYIILIVIWSPLWLAMCYYFWQEIYRSYQKIKLERASNSQYLNCIKKHEW